MMIKCHFSRLAGEKKAKVQDVANATGIHRNTLTKLYRETTGGIDFETIEKLCNFFNCRVGDLLEYIPEDEAGKAQEAPQPNHRVKA